MCARDKHVCPAVEPYPGIVCGEYDDLFFNSVNPAAPTVGVPVHGPHGQIGSAGIEANGSEYDPAGETNDYEFADGIGSDSGDTNGVVYANGTVGLDYGSQAHTVLNGECTAYSDTPSATDYGSDTGETSSGEVGYWAPQGAPTGAGLLTAAGAPLVHLVTGPSLLRGLWNLSGSAYPAGAGDHPLSYAHIAPANAWVGIASGPDLRNQSQFQVAPTLGWFSYWSGSGGAPTRTDLGANLYLPPGVYTIEVLLSGYTPYIGKVNLTRSGAAPSISLTPNLATGVYTPLWAHSSSDLANISVNRGGFGLGSIGNQFQLESGTPTVGAPYGVAGSISWLFSGGSDFFFTVWIGEYLNSTTAYAESNPAPTFVLQYPSWQAGFLDYYGFPSSNQLTIYLYHVQDFTLAGTPHISSWVYDYVPPLASVICNDCQNVLIAHNTFAVSDEGLALIDGGTSVHVGTALASTRNVVWRNTFVPFPQSAHPIIKRPSTALIVTESYDRIYNNAFDAVGPHLNATAYSPTADSNWWNVTCQPGYDPLLAAQYPGPTVCEPLSYATSVNGFTLTGSIVNSRFQGGNFWASYGNEPNPYGNIPFKAQSKSLTASPGIGSDTRSSAGDYAPLTNTTVYRSAWAERGLPDSKNVASFQVSIFAASGGGLLWYNSSATTAAPGGCQTGGNCVRFYLPNGSYQFHVAKLTLVNSTYRPHPGTGMFNVSGARGGTTSVKFRPVREVLSPQATGAVGASGPSVVRVRFN
jgi:thermopsin